jgi:hypothetical protein
VLFRSHDFNNEHVNRQSANVAIDYPPGSHYFFKDYRQKVYAGPLWDFDLICNITYDYSLNPRFYTSYNKAIMPTIAFHKRFFDDPVFQAKWRKTWNKHKADFQAMPAFIDSLAGVLQSDNTASTQGGLSSKHSEKISSLKTWWNNRITFFDSDVTAKNYDISKDIIDQTPSSSSNAQSSSSSSSRTSSSSSAISSSSTPSSSSNVAPPSSSSSSNENTPVRFSQIAAEGIYARAIGNSIMLENLPQNAKVEIYNLQGRLIYVRALRIVRALRATPQQECIEVQTKGIYIIKVTSASSSQILRIIVK